MRYILITCLLINLSYADHKLNFNDPRDVVTCNNGSYVITKQSTKDEIIKNCKPIGASRNRGSAGPVQIEFWGDDNARVKCKLQIERVVSCRIKD